MMKPSRGEPLMATQREVMEHLANQVEGALDAADLEAFADLLDPNVEWGAPVDPAPACQNRQQVLAWYRRGRDAGTRARVVEVTILDDRILVGLMVTSSQGGAPADDEAERWQVFTVSLGRVVDIAGFDNRSDASAYRKAQRP
jgi:hypothetical protein